MKSLAWFAAFCLISTAALGDILAQIEGHWRGTGIGQDFNGEASSIRCRLDVATNAAGRTDLRGTCAAPEGRQSFRLFLRNTAEPNKIEGGRLSVNGEEVSPFFLGIRSPSGLTINGQERDNIISIQIHLEGGGIRIISTRERRGRVELSNVLYQRS